MELLEILKEFKNVLMWENQNLSPPIVFGSIQRKPILKH